MEIPKNIIKQEREKRQEIEKRATELGCESRGELLELRARTISMVQIMCWYYDLISAADGQEVEREVTRITMDILKKG